MDDAKLLELLRAIKSLALLPSPPPPNAGHDPGLVLALGEIAGRASRAIGTFARARGETR